MRSNVADPHHIDAGSLSKWFALAVTLFGSILSLHVSIVSFHGSFVVTSKSSRILCEPQRLHVSLHGSIVSLHGSIVSLHGSVVSLYSSRLFTSMRTRMTEIGIRIWISHWRGSGSDFPKWCGSGSATLHFSLQQSNTITDFYAPAQF